MPHHPYERGHTMTQDKSKAADVTAEDCRSEGTDSFLVRHRFQHQPQRLAQEREILQPCEPRSEIRSLGRSSCAQVHLLQPSRSGE